MSRTVEHDGCIECKYDHFQATSSHCQGCIQNAVDKYTRMTNADWIRNMTDEELAKFLESVEDGAYNDSSITPKGSSNYPIDMLEWLERKYEG